MVNHNRSNTITSAVSFIFLLITLSMGVLGCKHKSDVTSTNNADTIQTTNSEDGFAVDSAAYQFILQTPYQSSY